MKGLKQVQDNFEVFITKKQKMKTLHAIILILTFTFALPFSSVAADVLWTGGNGNWSSAYKWSTGKVPTKNDVVFIISGIVTLGNQSNIHSLVTSNIASLTISSSGKLNIATFDDSDGIRNEGTIISNGTIDIQTYFTGNTNNAAIINWGILKTTGATTIEGNFEYGIFNPGELNVNAGSSLSITDLKWYGIQNLGYIKNEGEIDIIDFSRYGIDNRSNATFHNHKDLYINPLQQSNYPLFSNGGIFTNYKTGFINLENQIGNHGLLVLATGVGKNFGEIIIHDVAIGMRVSEGGIFTNEKNGILKVSDTTNNGAYVVGLFKNIGYLEIKRTNSAVSVTRGKFTNFPLGTLVADDNNVGIHIQQNVTTEFENFGTIFLTNTDLRSLSINSLFINKPKGRLYFDDIITIWNSAEFINQGHCTSTSASGLTHIVDGIFINTGIIGDVSDSMDDFLNLSVRARPITSNAQVGVPISNALDVASFNSVTVLAWYTSETGLTLAGSYNASNNTFTPNSNAQGLTELYVRVRVNASGITRRYKVKIPNGVQFAGPSPVTARSENSELPESKIIGLQNFQVFPNPVSDYIHIKNLKGQSISLEILDMNGKLLLSEYAGEIDGNISIVRQHHLVSGSYILLVKEEGTLIGTRRMIFTD